VAATDEGETDRLLRQFRALVDHSSDVITVLDPDGSWRYSSEGGSRRLGYPKGTVFDGGIFGLVHPDDVGLAVAAFTEVVDGTRGDNDPVVFRVRNAAGEWRWFESVGRNLSDDPDVRGIIITSREVTERVRAEQTRQSVERLFRTAFDHAPVGIALVTPDQRFTETNAAFVLLLGYESGVVDGLPLAELVSPEDREEVAAAIDSVVTGRVDRGGFEAQCCHVDGHVVWIQGEVSMVRDANGEPDYVVLLATDITERKQREHGLLHRAAHDALTQLPNRLALLDLLGDLLETEPEAPIAVLFVDLDGFKQVNDTHGHHAGDRVLAEVARRLLNAVRGHDVVTRHGGDEFVVVCRGVTTSDLGSQIGQRICQAIRRPFDLDGVAIQIGATVGVARNGPGATAESLVHTADAAMYEGKRAGRNQAVVAGH
jgi:diguanylate cyclase (GGDEF)-like protein/PAS domain S-box-containing protein